MRRSSKTKLRYILVILIAAIFLFPKNVVFAESYTSSANNVTYTYSLTDDGSDGPDVSANKFLLTGYGDPGLHCGLSDGTGTDTWEWGWNEKYGWREVTAKVNGEKYRQGETYVVLAAATHALFGTGRTHNSVFWNWKLDHIHYFNFYDTVQFKFDPVLCTNDCKNDTNVYNGIIFDSCNVSMFPQYDRCDFWPGSEFLRSGENYLNEFDIYFGINGESSEKSAQVNHISGQAVSVSSDGTWSSNSDSTKKTMGEFWLNFFASIHNTLGDAIQKLIDSVGTDTTLEDNSKITYSMAEVQSTEEIKDLINVSTNSAKKDKNTIKNVSIPSTVYDKGGSSKTVYTTATKIPVIPIDIYSLSINKVNVVDINFLESSNNNPNKIWKLIRSIVSLISHMVLYMSAALILTMLIWRSILLVRASFGDTPDVAARSRKIMDNLVKAIALIAGIYLIMAFMNGFYKEMTDIILNGKDSAYIIRLNVGGVYSFNTNIIGWVKYRALSGDITQAYGYSWLYLFAAILDLLYFGLMFARMIIIGLLTIVAPLTAVMAMGEFNQRPGESIINILHFKSWMLLYMILLWYPFVVTVLYRIILSI